MVCSTPCEHLNTYGLANLKQAVCNNIKFRDQSGDYRICHVCLSGSRCRMLRSDHMPDVSLSR